MKRNERFDALKARAAQLREMDADERMAHFRALVERNKTRRGRGGPPAAQPAPADGPKGGGLSGGAAALMTDRPDARDFV